MRGMRELFRNEKKNKTAKHAAAFALSLALVFAAVCPAAAYVRIDTSASCSLTVNYADGEAGIPGARFRLYKVADVSDAASYTTTADFEGAGIDWSAIPSAGSGDSSYWTTLASTLSSYAAANGISFSAEDVTDSNGRIEFENLDVGLYLLSGESSVVGDYLYTPSASMILLPTLGGDDTWSYEPSVTVKYDKETLTEYTDITVIKSWNDDGYEGRPDSVTAQLIRDGEVIDTKELNAAGDWKYTWENLPTTDITSGSAYTYTVNEADIPDGYTYELEQNGNVYRITNSYADSGEEPTDGDEPTTPGSPGSDEPTTPASSGGSGGSSGGSGGSSGGGSTTLPNTGQLKWPIPYLAAGGLVLICAGIIIGRKRSRA